MKYPSLSSSLGTKVYTFSLEGTKSVLLDVFMFYLIFLAVLIYLAHIISIINKCLFKTVTYIIWEYLFATQNRSNFYLQCLTEVSHPKCIFPSFKRHIF